jgi:hypothetical protein
MGLQTCGSCGFVSPSLDDPRPFAPVRTLRSPWKRVFGSSPEDREDDAARDRVRGAVDEDLVVPAGVAEAVHPFTRRAQLLGDAHPHEAGTALLHAAWIADDADAKDAARTLRAAAARHLRTAWSKGPTDASDGLVLADVLRRSGQFDEAGRVLDAVERLEGVEDVVRDVVRLQRVLVDRRDDACHGVEEATTSNALQRVEITWVETTATIPIGRSRLVGAGCFSWWRRGPRGEGMATAWSIDGSWERPEGEVPRDVPPEIGQAVHDEVARLGFAKRDPAAGSDCFTVRAEHKFRFHVECDADSHDFTVVVGVNSPLEGADAEALQALVGTVLAAAGRPCPPGQALSR